ncbi:MAG: outer membrane protein assembly factor BamD [Nitrospirae bacterium]|nr:MAG: outer membrane protein assembly factor BamD [Nitrospirota bacterium]
MGVRVKIPLLVFALAIGLSFGCSSTPKQTATGGKSASGTDEQIFIGDTVEKNYDPNVIMKRAEAFFDKEEYAEALVEYQHFLDLHRAHTLSSYAQFKIGMSFFKMSKSIDRDPAPLTKAQDAFEKLMKEYPGSKYQAEAIEKIKACNDLLAQTYYFVGQFYYRRESYLAAAYRFESIVKKFPEMEVAPDALYYLALSYSELGANDWAHDKLVQLAQQYPANKHQKESQTLLAKVNAKLPPGTALAKAQSAPAAPNAPSAADLKPATVVAQAPAPILPSAGAAPSAPPIAQSLTAVSTKASTLTPQVTLCRIGSWC